MNKQRVFTLILGIEYQKPDISGFLGYASLLVA
jgi:hypothetical protein